MAIAAALADYWWTYTDPITGENPVFPIQQIRENTWYTFGYHIKPSTTEVDIYLNNALVAIDSSAGGLEGFPQVDDISFYGDYFPQGDTDNLQAEIYLDNVKAGTSGFGSVDILEDDFESYTLNEEWIQSFVFSRPPWTTINSSNNGAIHIISRPFSGSGKCLRFTSHNQIYPAGPGWIGGSIYYDWGGTDVDSYVQFEMAFSQVFIDQVIRGNVFAANAQVAAVVCQSLPEFNVIPVILSLTDASVLDVATGKLAYYRNGSWHVVKDLTV